MNDTVQLSSRFREVVTSDAELHAVVGQPPDRSIAKVIHSIDGHARQFIAHAPFVFVASAGKDGMIDVSPKGDPAGFVKVLNDRTLAIPDRLGNRRIDTFRNVLRNPNVGLIFLIPGVTYTLRVSGKAIIVRDLELRESMAVNGKLPDHVLVIDVKRVLSHCPKCMILFGTVGTRCLARHDRSANICRDAKGTREARRDCWRGPGDHRQRKSRAAVLNANLRNSERSAYFGPLTK